MQLNGQNSKIVYTLVVNLLDHEQGKFVYAVYIVGTPTIVYPEDKQCLEYWEVMKWSYLCLSSIFIHIIS